MRLFLTLLFPLILAAQDFSSYYVKFFANSYRETDTFYDDNYSAIDQRNDFIFNTYSIDATYRFSKTWQSRFMLPFVNVQFNDLDRSEFTDLWSEVHYYFSQYPQKMYIGAGLKVPLGYDESEDPWLSNGASEFRLKFLMKNTIKRDMDYEVDIKADFAISKSDRINSGGLQIPYFFSLSFYDDEWTYLPVISGVFKSYEYGNSNGNSIVYGDAYNQFSVELGGILKYKLESQIEIELSYLRTLFGFQVPVANHFGLGLSFGIRD